MLHMGRINCIALHWSQRPTVLNTYRLLVKVKVCRPSWFPLGLENPEKRETIFQSGKSQGILLTLEKSGNFTQNTGKSEKDRLKK